jgi:hypothetical protein
VVEGAVVVDAIDPDRKKMPRMLVKLQNKMFLRNPLSQTRIQLHQSLEGRTVKSPSQELDTLGVKPSLLIPEALLSIK